MDWGCPLASTLSLGWELSLPHHLNTFVTMPRPATTGEGGATWGWGQSQGRFLSLFPPAESHDCSQLTHSWPLLRLAWGTRPATDKLLFPIRGGHFPDPGQLTGAHNIYLVPKANQVSHALPRRTGKAKLPTARAKDPHSGASSWAEAGQPQANSGAGPAGRALRESLGARGQRIPVLT